jgi:hypothetical protein
MLEYERMTSGHTMSAPQEALLEQKMLEFSRHDGFKEIKLADHFAFHLSHPTRPRIEKTHLLVLEVEIDAAAAHKPLRQQFKFIKYSLPKIKDYMAALKADGYEHSYEYQILSKPSPLEPTNEKGTFHAGTYVFLSGHWKGARARDSYTLANHRTQWIDLDPLALVNDFVDADWFPFLQESMEGPPAAAFRDLLNRKIDLATREFDFELLGTFVGLAKLKTMTNFTTMSEVIFRLAEETRETEWAQVIRMGRQAFAISESCPLSHVHSPFLPSPSLIARHSPS